MKDGGSCNESAANDRYEFWISFTYEHNSEDGKNHDGLCLSSSLLAKMIKPRILENIGLLVLQVKQLLNLE